MLRAFTDGHSEIMKWDVDSRLSTTNIQAVLDTEYIIVDGMELSWIMNSYLNIPHHRTEEPQIWTGDMARFIVAQLPAEDGQQ